MKKLISIILLTSLLLSQTTLCAKADPYHMFNQMTGVLTAAVFGPVFAMPRGAVKGAILGTKKVARKLGDVEGKPHLAIGAFTGGFAGAFAGAFAGFAKAERDAFKYGYSNPYSDESFSLGGTQILDYDPFYWGEFAY